MAQRGDEADDQPADHKNASDHRLHEGVQSEIELLEFVSQGGIVGPEGQDEYQHTADDEGRAGA